MKRIYVAGKYSDPNIIGCLNNIHDGIKASVAVLKAGDSPFCPWLDYQFQFFDKSLTVEDYYRYSMAWLEVSDEVWVLPGSENSKGTQAEIKRAKELGIPVYEYKKEALEVIEAWGFEYRTVAFVWVKETGLFQTCKVMTPWTMKSHELCLLGIRGQMQKHKTDNSVLCLVTELRTEHSRKPDEVRRRICKLFANGNKIELFARRKVKGWDVWGNEVKSDIDLL